MDFPTSAELTRNKDWTEDQVFTFEAKFYAIPALMPYLLVSACHFQHDCPMT